MATFVVKRQTVEAVQWTGQNDDELFTFLYGDIRGIANLVLMDRTEFDDRMTARGFHLYTTNRRDIGVAVDDWVIREGPLMEFTTQKPREFAESFELA